MSVPGGFGKVIKHTWQSHRFTLRHLADQVSKENGTPINPHFFGALSRVWIVQIDLTDRQAVR